MFGSQGPKSKRGGGPSRAPAAPSSRGAMETMIIEPSGPRRKAAAPDAPARVAGAARPAKARLVDLASDWLATVLALTHVRELPDAGALRSHVLELKSRFERDSGALGFAAADVEDAVFAMVAFLDQTVLNSKGPARDAWIGRPLQLELYGRQLAGEEFFERLDKLRHDREARIEALEVYCCCLAFGFAGRYLLNPDKLGPLLEEVQRDVAAARGGGFSPLAPNAGRRRERVAEERAGIPWWLPPAVFVPAVILAWLLVWVIARLGAGGAASAIERLAGR